MVGTIPEDVSSPNRESMLGPVVPPAGPHSSGGLGLGVPGVQTGGTGTTGAGSWELVGDGLSYVFSARTCLELLPFLSPTQLETEIKHLQALDASINFRSTRSADSKRDFLHKSLSGSLCREVDTIVRKYDILLQNISRSVTEAQLHVDGIAQSLITTPPTDTATDHIQPDAGNTELEIPVRFIDTSFADMNYSDIEEAINFTDNHVGGRKTAYFGSTGYSYGPKTHVPAAYPDHPVFECLFDRLQEHDPDFSRENYTCLATQYPHGRCTLPMHHDDEKCIVPGSTIYTVSFGATRTVRFLNIEQRLQLQEHKLEHGSVHCMSKESQSIWKHGITIEPEVTGSRISFTFRKLLKSPPSPEVRKPVPRIAPPSAPKSADRPTRVLLLTDSIHSRTPPHLFESVPNHICIRKTNYELTNLHNFSPEFAYTDCVIVSCGINDLSRYGHTASSLADCVAHRFKEYSRKYPNTKFIFNSLLWSRDYRWLNAEVDLFNNYMFELSRSVRNMYYFDSHNLVSRSNIRNVYASGARTDLAESDMRTTEGNNGVHVTLEVRRLVVRELVNSVGYLAGCRTIRFRSCEWLHNVTTRSSWAG